MIRTLDNSRNVEHLETSQRYSLLETSLAFASCEAKYLCHIIRQTAQTSVRCFSNRISSNLAKNWAFQNKKKKHDIRISGNQRGMFISTDLCL